MNTWLLIDVSFLAWRAYHAFGELSFDGMRTEVCYGVYKEIQASMELFATNYVACFFDRSPYRRAEIYPEYKQRTQDPENQEQRRQVLQQIRQLHNQHLKQAGFPHIYSKRGFEADDLIASACEELRRDQRAIIVACDQDLYQLLGPRVRLYNPIKKRVYTHQQFREDYGISPSQWADVKAIAGCASDNIQGIAGIGEKTAIKHLHGQTKGKTFDKIIAGTSIWERNILLTQLPFLHTPRIELQEQPVDRRAWARTSRELGMRSLML